MSYMTPPDPKRKTPIPIDIRTPLEEKIAKYVYDQYKKGELKWTHPNYTPTLTACNAHYRGELKQLDGSTLTILFYYYGKDKFLTTSDNSFLRIGFNGYGDKILEDAREAERQRIRKIKDEEASLLAEKLGIELRDPEESAIDPLEEMGCRFVNRTVLNKEGFSIWCYLGIHKWQVTLDYLGPDGHRHMTRQCQHCEATQALHHEFSNKGMKLKWRK